jgi:hypothetical protein
MANRCNYLVDFGDWELPDDCEKEDEEDYDYKIPSENQTDCFR